MYSNGAASASRGGGINNFHGHVILNDASSVSGNRAIFYGGGVFNNHGTLSLRGTPR